MTGFSWSVICRRIAWLVLGLEFAAIGVADPRTGDDVVAAFARAARGEPLRYVAIGGSITQASGPGWIGDWLREQFPESDVTVFNSGMSATGSSLGIFRIERDAVAHQPDLVAIEYCVNDSGLPDEQAIRYLETLVVRLKSLPHPPAIIILEAATRHGVNLDRHRQVARHYGLLEVDWQVAIDERLHAGKTPLPAGLDRGDGSDWGAYFSDNVHPNDAGHAFYAETLRDVLRPLVVRARTADFEVFAGAPLPAPLSERPLLLDARMVPLHGLIDEGWRPEPSPPGWWNRFFQGVLTAEKSGAVLRIPFRGTTAGVFYALHGDHGSFYLNVNGDLPTQVFANTRAGYASVLAAVDLPAREHELTIVLPPEAEAGLSDDPKANGPVQMGYLLVAGETGAGRDRGKEGAFDTEALKALRFQTMPASRWSWTRPFPVEPEPEGHMPFDARRAITKRFLPEPGEPAFSEATVDWRPVEAKGGRVDFRALTGSNEPAVAYAKTEWTSTRGGGAILSVEVDNYAHLWLNGERVLAQDSAPRWPVFLPVRLKPGTNTFFLKAGAGIGGFSFRLRVAEMKPDL